MHQGSDCYELYLNDKPVAFAAMINFPHKTLSRVKRFHRVVVLPDYQGLGLGTILINQVAKIYKEDRWHVFITTNNPALINSFKRFDCWRLINQGRVSRSTQKSLGATTASNRLTTSWKYI